jgi:hypothetical protein
MGQIMQQPTAHELVRQLIALAERHGAKPGDPLDVYLGRAFDSRDPHAMRFIRALEPLNSEAGVKRLCHIVCQTCDEWEG